MSLITESKPHFENVIEHFKSELQTVRTGQANPGLLENIMVDSYGSTQNLKAVASISVPDSRTLQIEPWDASNVKAIESAIMKSNLGMPPNVDGKIIRLIMPMMTDEIRQRMLKIIKEKTEEARIAVKRTREDYKKKIDKLDGGSDDEKRDLQSDLDETVKEFNKLIEEVAKKKEGEISSI
jgi:ribosome recycling factor